ncbi:aspartate aminotransferase family protein [Clostridium polyendosporum]|uniref:(S)-3-amino-2-methylpropionate transaminase n=1 Tax=Clostridium polyendosporum TaxID=69208 RepID=A0A919RW68_9CLOT|nr:aspartate aminotransferase family protein [Clostridium polyendosporum]GIM27597.1 aspartate aminotransferase family protein [Clostridium polyendosporum]
MSNLYERCSKVMPPAANRATKLGVTSGKGSYLYTEEGKKVLDFASGVAVCNVGHNNDLVNKAAIEQINKLVHGCHNVVYYESYVELAEKLVEITGNDTMVYFSNSGAEANEGAIKLAKYVTGRPALIAFKGSFHGRTIATTSITSSISAYRKNYEGLLPSVYFAEYPNSFRGRFKEKDGGYKGCIDELEDMFKKIIDPFSVAAMILESVQGEGGYIVPPVEFMQEIRNICDRYGILLILDEIQTGFGRTGKMFAYEHFGIKPDIISCAKAIASGFPLSAVIAKKEIMEKWQAGAHGVTFGGNPVSCAAALATIDILEKGAIKNAEEMGSYFKERLLKLQEKYDAIGEVRGLGLMLAIELVDKNFEPNSKLVKSVIENCLDKGLLLLSCGTDKNVIRFIPPTTVSKYEIDEALAILDEAFKACV